MFCCVIMRILQLSYLSTTYLLWLRNNLYPVLYENIIHKAITDNFSLTEVQFCTMFCKNVYSYHFSDGRGTILNYVHIYICPTSV